MTPALSRHFTTGCEAEPMFTASTIPASFAAISNVATASNRCALFSGVAANFVLPESAVHCVFLQTLAPEPSWPR